MIFQGTAIPNLIIEVAGIMICLFALIAAHLTGNLVLADEAGRFSYGAAGSMEFVLTAMFMIIDLIMLLRLGQN